ncbi:MAG: Mce-associated rane protein [Pseudonocardiales bacterium]|nr:Mce-associated rane protein [Pseudonocardiales bacterium]MDT7636600.1 Mce-associated rane protein [Pseudonocardiales bacterium]
MKEADTATVEPTTATQDSDQPSAADAAPAEKAAPTGDAAPAEKPAPAEGAPAEGAAAEGAAAAPAGSVTEPAKAGRFPLRLPLPAAIGVAVVLVLAVAAAVTFGLLLQRRVATDRAGAEALATAKAYAVTVTSYDYQNLDRNFADVLDGATGEFKDQYTGASQTLRQLIANAKATAKGNVLGAGISSESPEQVEVVVFVDQTITNAATAQPRVDRNRVIMTLTPHDGRWLVGKLELT